MCPLHGVQASNNQSKSSKGPAGSLDFVWRQGWSLRTHRLGDQVVTSFLGSFQPRGTRICSVNSISTDVDRMAIETGVVGGLEKRKEMTLRRFLMRIAQES